MFIAEHPYPGAYGDWRLHALEEGTLFFRNTPGLMLFGEIGDKMLQHFFLREQQRGDFTQTNVRAIIHCKYAGEPVGPKTTCILWD